MPPTRVCLSPPSPYCDRPHLRPKATSGVFCSAFDHSPAPKWHRRLASPLASASTSSDKIATTQHRGTASSLIPTNSNNNACCRTEASKICKLLFPSSVFPRSILAIVTQYSFVYCRCRNHLLHATMGIKAPWKGWLRVAMPIVGALLLANTIAAFVLALFNAATLDLSHDDRPVPEYLATHGVQVRAYVGPLISLLMCCLIHKLTVHPASSCSSGV